MKHHMGTGSEPRARHTRTASPIRASQAMLAGAFEDRDTSFALFVVQDFLAKNGLLDTLRTFQDESRKLGGPPSDASWFEVSDALELGSIMDAHTERQKEGKAGSGGSTVLDAVLGHLKAAAAENAPQEAEVDTWPAGMSTDPYGESTFETPPASPLPPSAPPSAPGSTKKFKPKPRRSGSTGAKLPDTLSASASLPSLANNRSKRSLAPTRKSPTGGQEGFHHTGRNRGRRQDDSSTKSKLFHLPLGTRMSMLKREMAVLEASMAEQDRMERELKTSSLSEVELAKDRDEYLARSSKVPQCALCEKEFALMNLPLVISFKAVLDLRASWGMTISEKDLKDPRLQPPACYDGVRTCRFCAQFFSVK